MENRRMFVAEINAKLKKYYSIHAIRISSSALISQNSILINRLRRKNLAADQAALYIAIQYYTSLNNKELREAKILFKRINTIANKNTKVDIAAYGYDKRTFLPKYSGIIKDRAESLRLIQRIYKLTRESFDALPNLQDAGFSSAYSVVEGNREGFINHWEDPK